MKLDSSFNFLHHFHAWIQYGIRDKRSRVQDSANVVSNLAADGVMEISRLNVSVSLKDPLK